MKKMTSYSVAIALLFAFVGFAQDIQVSGTVTSAVDGQPVPGATVQVKDTQTGVQTDFDGKYTISAPQGGTLVFSFLGMKTEEAAITGSVLDLAMKEDSSKLDEVIVTALGVKKSEKALSYSAQVVKSEELGVAPSPNFSNSLTGKVSNVRINQSASGVGGANKIVLRGNTSLSGSNDPLIVIDGTPVSNYKPNVTAGNEQSAWGGNPDSGDDLSNINPDDIESITVLKGASAAALYGSQGANGAILITTKSAKDGVERISVSSNTSISQVLYTPEFQNRYGRQAQSSNYSWSYNPSDAATQNANAAQDFFKTGLNTINSIGFSSGIGKIKTYFSYANTNASGVIDKNALNRHSFNGRLRSTFLDDKLSVDFKTTYTSAEINNKFLSGIYFNPLPGLYFLPRDLDFNQYKNYEATPGVQNWHFIEDKQQNPYWAIHRNPNSNERNKLINTTSLKYDILEGLAVQARGTVTRTSDKFEQQNYQGTSTVLASTNGGWKYINQTSNTFYGDLLLTYNKDISDDFSFSGILGTSLLDQKSQGISIDTQANSLIIPNLFNITNVDKSLRNAIYSRSQLQAAFTSLEVAYKKALYLTVTGRNDWSSTLPTKNRSFFYPSVGVSAVVSDLVDMPQAIDFFKVRGSVTQVGNTVNPFVSNPVNKVVNGQLSLATAAPFEDLKPELTTSIETGFEIVLFQKLVQFDMTYYDSETKNQFFTIQADAGSGFSQRYVNGGLITNKGIESSLSFNFKFGDLSWVPKFNYSVNVNKVEKLYDGIKKFVITPSGTTSFQTAVEEGGRFGDIYSKVLKRDDQGRLLISNGVEEGGQRVQTTQLSNDFVKIANSSPDYLLSMQNTFNYKNFSLSFLIDGRFGGQVVSLTEAMMDKYGTSAVTGAARDAGFVSINGVDENGQAVTQLDPQTYYNTQSGRAGALGQYVYDATTVRIRELSISYKLPKSIVGGEKFVKSATVGLTARNLLYLYRPAPFDSDVTSSSGNRLQGADLFNLPANRVMGINLKLNF